MIIPIEKYDIDLEVFHAWSFVHGCGRLSKRNAADKLAKWLVKHMKKGLKKDLKKDGNRMEEYEG